MSIAQAAAPRDRETDRQTDGRIALFCIRSLRRSSTSDHSIDAARSPLRAGVGDVCIGTGQTDGQRDGRAKRHLDPPLCAGFTAIVSSRQTDILTDHATSTLRVYCVTTDSPPSKSINVPVSQFINQSIYIFETTQYAVIITEHTVYSRKAVREASRSLNWPPELKHADINNAEMGKVEMGRSKK